MPFMLFKPILLLACCAKPCEMAKLSPMNIGVKIVELRLAKGWNQSDLAAALGVDQSTVSKIERGVSKANMETLNKFAKVLGVSLTELVGEGVQEVASDQRIEALNQQLLQLREELDNSKKSVLPTAEIHEDERSLLADIRRSKIPNLIRDLRILLIAAPQLLEATLKAVQPQLPQKDPTPPANKKSSKKKS